MPFVKKAFAVLLTMLLLISLFSSCGSEAQDELPEEEDVTNIRWYGIGGALPEDFQEGVDAINEYLREKIGVELQWPNVGWIVIPANNVPLERHAYFFPEILVHTVYPVL